MRGVHFRRMALTFTILCAGSISARAETLTGVINVNVTIASGANVPMNTTINLNLGIAVSGYTNPTSDDQYATVTATVRKTSASQLVTIQYPYEWVLQNPFKNVSLSLSVTPALTYPLSDTVGLSTAIPLPANGATTNLAAPVQL